MKPTSFLLVMSVFLVAFGGLRAQNLIVNGTFEGDAATSVDGSGVPAVGSSPTGWTATGQSGSQGQESVVTAGGSSFGGGNQSLLFYDANGGSSSLSRVSLTQTISSVNVATAYVLSFDFKINGDFNLTNNDAFDLRLGGTSAGGTGSGSGANYVGLRINDNSGAASSPGMLLQAYQNTGNPVSLTSLSLGTWYHVEVDVPALQDQNNTLVTIKLTASDGTTTTFTTHTNYGGSVIDPSTFNISMASGINGAPNNGAANISIDNLSLVAAPEPSSVAAAAFGLGVLGLLAGRRAKMLFPAAK